MPPPKKQKRSVHVDYIRDDGTVMLNDGSRVRLEGVVLPTREEMSWDDVGTVPPSVIAARKRWGRILAYMRACLQGRRVVLVSDMRRIPEGEPFEGAVEGDFHGNPSSGKGTEPGRRDWKLSADLIRLELAEQGETTEEKRR